MKKEYDFTNAEQGKFYRPIEELDIPIYLDDDIIGKTTSGNYSFNYDKNLSFGYINSDITNEKLKNESIFIEVEKKKYQAEILLKPLKHINFKTI